MHDLKYCSLILLFSEIAYVLYRRFSGLTHLNSTTVVGIGRNSETWNGWSRFASDSLHKEIQDDKTKVHIKLLRAHVHEPHN
ncbi:unnamed protein product [Urochloa humidicola]